VSTHLKNGLGVQSIKSSNSLRFKPIFKAKVPFAMRLLAVAPLNSAWIVWRLAAFFNQDWNWLGFNLVSGKHFSCKSYFEVLTKLG
jgi:hypothetical protein